MGNSVPGGCFIGRPVNNADEQTQAVAVEPKPANTQTSGDNMTHACMVHEQDFFVGTTENLRPQATEQPQPAGELRISRRFMDCMSSGSSKEESRVPLTSRTGVNAHNMEDKRNRISDNPRKLPFELIKQITKDFCLELGRGAFGQVFKGVLEDGEEVAVKMLRFMGNINDKQFENEFEILMRLQHPNIVRLVGFCDEAEEELVEYKGKRIVCQRIHRALCLEYMPNGSLGKLLSGENLGKDWSIRHKIIKGICKGLKYLQEGLESPIFHLDLKPDNILLGRQMMPKISDFGLSRLIGEENTKKTLTPLGTIGYLPPEFINYQVISKEYDIYSLGVIITKIIVTGITDYSDVADMDAQDFVEHVHENWKKCLQEIPRYESLEVDCKQVKRWIKVARKCMENDRHKRPTIKDIVSQLDEVTSYKFKLKEELGGGLSALPRGELVRYKKQKCTNMHKDPPSSEICHPAHPEHKLKLTTGTLFLCDGCEELGYGLRYKCDCGGGGQTFDLHTRCALARDPLFHLETLVRPLFGYGKLGFCFLDEAPSPVDARICDACGEHTRGYVYHCSEQDVDIHPCCASLPDRFLHDGRAFDLHRRASRPCALCPENEGQRRWFWAYRCYLDGEEAAVDLHVACLKETARRSWDADYRNWPDVGVDGMLAENMFNSSIRFDKFGEIVGTVASFITALVFGSLIVNM